MKKETQIHATVEVIDIMPNFSFTGGTIEEVKEQAKQGLKARFEPLGFDNINITNIEVVEIEERISTEDLIDRAKWCLSADLREDCGDCPFKDKDCGDDLLRILADRLEELHQQTATPKVKSDIKRYCGNCVHASTSLLEEPCCYCKTEWKEA